MRQKAYKRKLGDTFPAEFIPPTEEIHYSSVHIGQGEGKIFTYAKIFFLLFLHTVNHYAQQSSEPKKSVHVASPLIDPLLMELELDEGANVKLRLSFLGEKVATTLKQVDHFGSEEDLARNNFCKLLKTCCIVNNTITNIFFLVVNFTRLEFGAVCIIVFPSGLV